MEHDEKEHFSWLSVLTGALRGPVGHAIIVSLGKILAASAVTLLLYLGAVDRPGGAACLDLLVR